MLSRFFRSEPAPGILLMLATALAIIVANSPLGDGYEDVLHADLFGFSVEHLINDALMAIFFLLAGLEIKRELIGGELGSWGRRILPGVAAICGMVVPAVVFLLVTRGEAELRDGWAISSATDIAFALGILSLLGSRVPTSLTVLLTSIAIIDDLGAIVVIAFFYSTGVAIGWLAVAAAIMAILFLMNRRGVSALWPYLVVGALLWFAIYRSGIHATLAGVIVAFAIPSIARSGPSTSPLRYLEHVIDPWVSFAIVPLFAFANAGVRFAGLGRDELVGALPVGVALGLFLGKQIGIFGAIWVSVRIGLAPRPAGASWTHVYGMAILCGIGFTMSLFIGGLAFASSPHLMETTRLGILGGSIISAIVGSILLARTLPPARIPVQG